MKKTVLELFAGGGGFRSGLLAGIEVVAAVENDPDVAAVYSHNFGTRELVLQDIRNVDFRGYSGVDCVVGGPPCQDFSVANKQANIKSDRAHLGLEFLRAIREVRPKLWILENVRGFSRSDVWKLFQQDCLEMGYVIISGILNAANYGVPQTRERFIAIGKMGGRSPVFPLHTHHNPYKGASLLGTKKWIGWWEAIADIFPQFINLSLADCQIKNLSSNALNCVERGESILIPRLGFNPKQRVPWKQSHEPAPTIRALGEKCNHQWAKFNIFAQDYCKLASTRALARWQSFPDSYKLPTADYLAGQVIGNAIPPRLAKALIAANI